MIFKVLSDDMEMFMDPDIAYHKEKAGPFSLSPPGSLQDRISGGCPRPRCLFFDKVGTGLQLRGFSKQLVSTASEETSLFSLS